MPWRSLMQCHMSQWSFHDSAACPYGAEEQTMDHIINQTNPNTDRRTASKEYQLLLDEHTISWFMSRRAQNNLREHQTFAR